MNVLQPFGNSIRGYRRGLSTLVGAGCKLLLIIAAWLSAGNSRTCAEEFMSLDDIRLSLKARTAVSEDIRFFYLNLGVPVHGGVTTVWGPVPSTASAQQIVELLGKIKGIQRVRNELTVIPEQDWPEEWRNVQPLLRPVDESNPSGNPLAISLRPPTPLEESAPLTLPPAVPVNPPVLGPPMLPPTVLAPGQLAAQERKPDLRATVQEAVKSDARYYGIEVAVEGGIVYIRGQGVILFTLAERVAGLPGVERVIIQPKQAGAGKK